MVFLIVYLKTIAFLDHVNIISTDSLKPPMYTPFGVSNPPIPTTDGSYCTPLAPISTPPPTQRITSAPSSVEAQPMPKTSNGKDLAHTLVPVLLKCWSPAPTHAADQGIPRPGPSYGEAQITAPPVVFPM